jgi:hypothetical protein
MSEGEPREILEGADRLWYLDGRAGPALALYRRAARAAPADPVAWFGLARALRAVGRADEARDALANARLHAGALSPVGREILAAEEARAAQEPAFRTELPDGALDVAALEFAGISGDGWLRIASAAEERGIYGLARWAYAHAGGGRDTLEQAGEMEWQASLAMNDLALMRPEGAPAPSASPGGDPPTAAAVPVPPPPVAIPAKDGGWEATAGPLRFAVHVEPRSSRLGGDVWVHLVLANAGDAPLAVNARLLPMAGSVARGAGEVVLQVRGPAGYSTTRRVSGRVGPPGPDDFALLQPGHELSRSHPLTRYESLHRPGRYAVLAEYRSDAPGEVDGVRAFRGVLRASPVELERSE